MYVLTWPVFKYHSGFPDYLFVPPDAWLNQTLKIKKITLTLRKYCYFSIIGTIGLPRVRSVVLRKGKDNGTDTTLHFNNLISSGYTLFA